MISRGRATHYLKLTVKNYWPLQGRRRAGSAASRALDASSANRSAHANCETRETQCQLLERAIDSPRALFLQLHNWYTTIVRAGAQKDVVRERDRTRHAYVQWLFARSESNHEKFGTAKSEAWRVGARMPRVRRVE